MFFELVIVGGMEGMSFRYIDLFFFDGEERKC